MYTDGSKEDKKTAMSFVCDDHEFSCRINDEASICTAELLAIEAAIEYISESSDEEFMIITDSLSSLQALKSQKLNNPIVSNILHMCHYLSGHKDIVSCWVPSHIGIQGNERADVLAKAGGKGVTSAWSPLGNFLEGQAHPNLSYNQVFLFF